MDKFGIFNLLNSFLGFSANNSAVTSEQAQAESEKKSTTVNDLLSALSPMLNNTKKENAEPQIKKEIETKKRPPIQNQMLKTLSTHDDFVKRVKQKNRV